MIIWTTPESIPVKKGVLTRIAPVMFLPTNADVVEKQFVVLASKFSRCDPTSVVTEKIRDGWKTEMNCQTKNLPYFLEFRDIPRRILSFTVLHIPKYFMYMLI